MPTNIIAYLHTTLAYQSAAMQLMVGQANLDARELHLQESLPIVAPATNTWKVAMPPEGVGGLLATSNYLYRFNAGRLVMIQKRPPRRGVTEAAENQPSLIDGNGAYQLATQWLAAISVDVAALESKFPHQVVEPASHAPAARERTRTGVTNRAATTILNKTTNRRPTMLPIFRVTWGGRSSPETGATRTAPEVSMDILGSTKQCTALQIKSPQWFKGPPLQVTNAPALLGPPPPPQHFVEEFLGGKAAFAAVAKPDRVTAWLLSSQLDEPDGKTNRTPAVTVDVTAAALLSKALTDFNSYAWLEEKGCNPDYGVRLRFTKGIENVEFLWCYQCDHLQVTYNGQTSENDCDAARPALVRVIQSLFPRDAVIKNLSPLNSNQPK